MSSFKIAQTDDPVSAKKARHKGMDLLARREYGFQELIERLETAGFESDAAIKAAETLRAEGLQSDKRFAEALCAGFARKGKGPLRVEMELRARGVPDSDIAEAQRVAAIDWFACAMRVRTLKFGDDLPHDFPERARQMRFLQYRGFDNDHIHMAVGGED